MDSPLLSVSIVVFRPDVGILLATLTTLRDAIAAAAVPTALWIIDNGEDEGSHAFAQDAGIRQVLSEFGDLHVLSGHGNVGFGRGHNLALASVRSRYHLVLNPDVELVHDTLKNAITWLDDHPDFGVLVPRTASPNGDLQHLCRRYPSLCILMLRGFAPRVVRHVFDKRLAAYEMRAEIDAETVITDPPFVSGCCMFCRTESLRQVGGFDPGFFLYFEDYDLSLRLKRYTRLAYVPAVRIMHRGGDAARKGMRHVMMFVRSALRFFRLHGWRLC